MSLRLALIADDLTGAMDTGLQFSKYGLETLVLMDWDELPDAQVIVVDTDSRDAPASQARQRAASAARLLQGRAVYKKVDSTMRGNVGYELRALLEVLQPRAIVVAPAFPRAGRTTLWGHQQVNGQPLELTFFARDPRWPMTESHLPTLLMQQAGCEVGHIGLEDVRQGVDSLTGALQARPERIIVVDAIEQDHLRTIAQALVALGGRWLPCGSAGLAEEWVRALGVERETCPPAPPRDGGPVLLVIGSRNEAMLQQVNHAVQALGLSRVDLDARRVYDTDAEVGRLAQGCIALLSEGRDVILTSSFAPLVAGAGGLVARALADAVAQIAARRRLGGLFLSGGDIAVAVCRALGVRALRIAKEVQPGIPGGQLLGGRCNGLWVVTKAGGFGDRTALVDALAYLHGA